VRQKQPYQPRERPQDRHCSGAATSSVENCEQLFRILSTNSGLYPNYPAIHSIAIWKSAQLEAGKCVCTDAVVTSRTGCGSVCQLLAIGALDPWIADRGVCGSHRCDP
jgi:hypothetical protein